MTARFRLPCTSALFALVAFASVNTGHAQRSEAARAEQLFNDGKARLAEHDYAQACPLLAESFHAEPATGALLALALCHEQSGKLATAQREYADAALRSHGEQQGDREEVARNRARELAASVSTITIDGAAVAKDVVVELNGAPVAAERLGKAIPVDGGENTIEASAPGKLSWTVQLQVAAKSDAQHVVIPALSDALPPAHASASAGAPRRDSPSLPAEGWVGLGSLGAGVITLGVGTVLAVRASDEPKATNDDCTDGTCTYRETDNQTRDASTLCFVVGGVLAATGALIYLISLPSSSSSSDSASAEPSLTADAFVLPGAGGASVHGRF